MKLIMLNITSGSLSGGYKKYLRAITPELCLHPEIEDLHVFVHPHAYSSLGFSSEVIRPWPEALGDLSSWLRERCRETNCDAILVPNSRHVFISNVPLVTMVRNMEPLRHPFAGHPARERARNLLRLGSILQSCWRADRIIAVSEHVKDYLTSRLRMSERKIGVVHHGVENPPVLETFTPPPNSPPEFFLVVGSIRPARGLELIVRALRVLSDSQLEIPILIAGDYAANLPHKKKVDRLAESLNVDHLIYWLGHMDSLGVSWLLQNSVAHVTASRAEACPNATLEAMANGAITVAPDMEPMPEFLGKSALYFSKDDPNSLARCMREVVGLPHQTRERLQSAAKSRALLFDWSRTANLTVREVMQAVSSKA